MAHTHNRQNKNSVSQKQQFGFRLSKQGSLFSSPSKDFPLSHGGKLRQRRNGRKARPLSAREPLHLVFKLNKHRLRHRSLRSHQGFKLVQAIVRRYSKHFYVQIEQISIQHDHIHCLIRTKRHSQYQNFFRVVAGQIAQQFLKEGLCLGWIPSSTSSKQSSQSVTDALKYSVQRLKGLSSGEWKLLWT